MISLRNRKCVTDRRLGAIIRDGDRNQVSFSVMGLSLSKKTNVLFLAKIAPYARDARACNCSDRARRN